MTQARAGQRRDGAPGTNNGDTEIAGRLVPIGGEIDVEFAVTFDGRVAFKKCDSEGIRSLTGDRQVERPQEPFAGQRRVGRVLARQF